MEKNILMVCYYYPPLRDVGCKRSVAFAKYWKMEGWNPYVLSIKNPDTGYCTLGKSADVNSENTKVFFAYSLFNIYKFFGKINGILTRSLSLFGYTLGRNYFYDIVCIPDIFIGWIPHAVFTGLKIIQQRKIDVIYTSCSPFSAGIIGLLLKKLTGKPLVIDFRDPYGLDISKYQKKSVFKLVWFRKTIDHWVANKMLKSCDLFTVTTEETRQLYLEQFPFVKDKIQTVYNGFDPACVINTSKKEKFSKFTIIYFGNFYYHVDFDYFFAGINLLKKEGKVCADNFQVLIYGGIYERIKYSLERYDVEDLVYVTPRINYQALLEVISRSHLQLLRIIQPMISTKLFEGIALGIPFLATIPPGEVENIVTKYSPSSQVITSEDSAMVRDGIHAVIENYTVNEIRDNLVEEFLEKFSRQNQAVKLLRFIEQCDIN